MNNKNYDFRLLFRTLVCLTALSGTLLRIVFSFYTGYGLPIFLYFTVQSNIMVCSFLLIELFHFRKTSYFHPAVQASIVLYILITGIVYNIMLAPGIEAFGINKMILTVNHTLTPILFFSDWLLNSGQQRIKWRHYLLWMIYPFIYLASASLEGAVTGVFRYPFLDFLNQPPLYYIIQLLIVIGAFFAIGALLVLLNRKLYGKTI